jgi:hypothetical protein
MRICFGHQSVGQDLVNALAAMPDLGMDVVETTDPEAFRKPVFAHCRVGRNGDPVSKCRSFAQVMDAGVGERVDIAFFKFCYVDITEGTDVEGLFQVYEDTMRDLARAYPRVTFLHVTVPLRCVPAGPVGWLRDRTGWMDRPRRDQLARHAVNQRLRRAYAGTGRLFDLAAIEATHPDGTPSSFMYRDEPIPTLVPAYTSDGGHLTSYAAGRAARGLLACLDALGADRTTMMVNR